MSPGIWVFVLSALVALSGCGRTTMLRRADSPPEAAALPTAFDPRIRVSLEAVIVRNGPGSWAREADWDEYLIRVRNLSSQSLRVRSVTLHDVFGAPVEARANRDELVKATVDGERRYGERRPQAVFPLDSRTSGTTVAVGTTIGAAAGGAYVVSASGGLVSAAFVAPAVAAVALPAIVVGVAMNRNASAVDEEIVRRHTVLPLEVAGGQDARLDVFFPVTKVPTRLVVAYAGADGNHDLELDTREQLATIHMEPPPRLERRIEPDFPQDAIAAGIASGHVVARLDLNADGGVTSVRILESEPPGVFDHEATRALFRWKYSETLALRRWARSEDVRLDFRR